MWFSGVQLLEDALNRPQLTPVDRNSWFGRWTAYDCNKYGRGYPSASYAIQLPLRLRPGRQ